LCKRMCDAALPRSNCGLMADCPGRCARRRGNGAVWSPSWPPWTSWCLLERSCRQCLMVASKAAGTALYHDQLPLLLHMDRAAEGLRWPTSCEGLTSCRCGWRGPLGLPRAISVEPAPLPDFLSSRTDVMAPTMHRTLCRSARSHSGSTHVHSLLQGRGRCPVAFVSAVHMGRSRLVLGPAGQRAGASTSTC